MSSSIGCQCNLQISLVGEGTLRHLRVEEFTPRLSPQSTQETPSSRSGSAPGDMPLGSRAVLASWGPVQPDRGRCCDSLEVPSAAWPSIWIRASIPQCFLCGAQEVGPLAVTPPGEIKGTLGRSQPFRLWAHREQLEWMQRGRHWVCWHPAWGCRDPLRTPRLPRAGLGWYLPFPSGPWPAGAAPSPHNWQGAAHPPALRDESWSFRGAGEEPGPGSSPPSP